MAYELVPIEQQQTPWTKKVDNSKVPSRQSSNFQPNSSRARTGQGEKWLASVSASTSTSVPASPALTNSSTAPSLGAGTTTIRFVTTKAFWDLVNSTNQEILTFQGVSPQKYIRLCEERGRNGRAIRFRRYKAQEGIFIILLPGTPHEVLHLRLYHEYTKQVLFTGLEYDWVHTGSTRFRQQGHPNGDGGEGDSTGTPASQSVNRWPTLVIEAGDSQSLEALREGMEWWFEASNYQVKIVLLAKLDRPRRRILLEKWVARPRLQTRSATTLGATFMQVRAQAITITWDPSLANTPASHAVTRGDLWLEFGQLFLRPPGPNEGDFVITALSMQMWSSEV
ncbi:hypothetical protein B0T25DRAFT_165687 [Lasiosphaeria hispida]|uniref:Uncharacterized protein n=1 Tax=Lasiosphaeria hispida TaxID=260671 RepID=A0AAJ0MGC4_9PEZI|nr:hypothetical protein B0T25DRAFT_165687 [Lasiosphaeria hispida]